MILYALWSILLHLVPCTLHHFRLTINHYLSLTCNLFVIFAISQRKSIFWRGKEILADIEAL